MALRRRHTQTNGDGASSHKTDYVGQVKEILNLKGPHLFKSYDHYTEWVDFAYWWSCIPECLSLQPMQQADLRGTQAS